MSSLATNYYYLVASWLQQLFEAHHLRSVVGFRLKRVQRDLFRVLRRHEFVEFYLVGVLVENHAAGSRNILAGRQVYFMRHATLVSHVHF